ncbi:hypothetical protein [uncultured Paracoccus sp.]|uniref:hypothetical protein n=1 Tax=uncultured Paracoccus sp. TaxID=189685 RepID=UPI002614F8A8|nr:hypothetical protein [uncultured Paracoccus sp.]
MSNQLKRIEIVETVCFDDRRLGAIVDDLGERAAEQVISAALDQIADGIDSILTAGAEGDAAAVLIHAEALARLAWQMGLVSLAGVAVDVGRCAELQDRISLSATISRLSRVGAQSLGEIWEGTKVWG